MGDMIKLKTSQIEENEVALRDVDVEGEQFLAIEASLRDRGFILPIAVRKEVEEQPKGPDGTSPPPVTRYILVDGLQRFTAACRIYGDGGTIPGQGADEVPCNVLDISEADVLETQIEGNLTRVETKPIEYSRQLNRLLMRHPGRTLQQQADRLHKSPSWLQQRLNLLTLEGEASKLVNDGKIGLSNATALARLSKAAPAEVAEWLDRAQNQTPDSFFADVNQRIKDLKKAAQTGQPAVASGPPEKMRKTTDVKAEYARAKAVAKADATDRFNQGYLAAFEWMTQQDVVSAEAFRKAQAEAAKVKADKTAARAAKAETAGV